MCVCVCACVCVCVRDVWGVGWSDVGKRGIVSLYTNFSHLPVYCGKKSRK